MQTKHRLPAVELVGDRHLYVLSRCGGKSVLHVGCTDSGLLEQRFGEGRLLHAQLARTASEVWGADIDAAGLKFLRGKGFDNLFEADAERLGEVEGLAGRKFEVVVAAEIVEHLSNPGLFLDGVKNFMTPGKTELVISVPNAFRPATLKGLFFGYEEVHPDHNFWFSAKTISNLLGRHGFRIEQMAVYTFLPIFGVKKRAEENEPGSPAARAVGFIKKVAATLLFRITPFFADGIIVAASLPPEKRSDS